MFKNNYSAWKLDEQNLSDTDTDIDKLLVFAKYGILAPSVHNTQPWLLKIRGNSIDLLINKEHNISDSESGLLSVEPYVSLGSFIETLNIAANAYGYKLKFSYFPTSTTIANIKISGKTKKRIAQLKAITERVSNRNYYKNVSIPKKDIDSILASSDRFVKVTSLYEKKDIQYIANKTEEAVKKIMSLPRYRNELSKWVRSNFTRKYDGMPGFTHGFGTFISFISKTLIKYSPKSGPQGFKSKKLIIKSSYLFIVSINEENKVALLNSGRTYARICIRATMLGYSTSALGASVTDAKTRSDVSKKFNIPGRAIYILRLGKTDLSASHSPRWPLEKLISK